MTTTLPGSEPAVDRRRVPPWIVAGGSILLALPGAGLSALSGLLDLSVRTGIHETLDACGMRQNWFWEAYQNNTGLFELALALVLAVVALTVIFAAWRQRLIATLFLGVLLVAASIWPFVVQHERSGDGGPMLIECHDL